MNYSYKIISIAANELVEAAIWYDDKRKGLGDEVILNFEATLNNILRNPLLFQKRFKQMRLANINRFPFQIIYIIQPEKVITIVAFFHTSRNPKEWMSRYNKLTD